MCIIHEFEAYIILTAYPSLEQGAAIPLRLGFEDLGGVSGRYWANSYTGGAENGEVLPW